LNPHSPCGETDFKSVASAGFATPPLSYAASLAELWYKVDSMKTFVRTEIALPLGAALLFLVTSLVISVPASLIAQAPSGAGVNSPWAATEVLHAQDLSSTIADKKAAQPQILQVGFETMFKTQHIPGSIYAGPARTAAGLELLQKAVAGVPKDRVIVLYCGCCPWDHCPNMKPAYTLLHGLGYKRIKVVEIPTSFQVDWIDKGFPVDGSAAH
jgi:thiosulfate/3-mercaptopyruvate sulfurtransferase